MPQSDDVHPKLETLTRFALGSLPESSAETVANHVADCATCAATVDAAPADFVLRRLSVVLQAGAPADDQASDASPPPAAFPVPAALRRHDKYQDFQLLGVGGMGLVFKAWQPAAQRFVALKVIQPELLGRPEVKARLLREAQALQRLHHPNIVGIHDVEEIDDLIVIVMEYLEGKNLYELGRGGNLPVAEACCYTRHAASGLQHAHEQGFVHRDIKPQNLIVGADGQVKIVDFGIVRFVATEELSLDLTADNALLGTPKYMAPEQARDPGSATVQSDLYALGCTLFYLLTGRPPYQEKTVIGVLVAQASQEPPSVRSLRPEAPAAVDALIRRLLAKRPAHRPHSASEVSAALAPFVDGADCRSASPRRRFTRLQAALVILVCLVAATLALVFSQVLRVQTPYGTIVVENLPKDAEVTIDGAAATIRRAGKEIVEVRAQAGKRKLEIRLQGSVIHSQDVVIELSDRHPLPIRLEPPKDKAATSPIRPPRFDLLEKPRGAWSIVDDELVQSAADRDALVIFGEPSWKDYDFSGEFMRTDGEDGVFFFFRYHKNDTYSSLMLGGQGNSVHILDTWADNLPQRPQPGWQRCAPCLEQKRWYKVKVCLRGEHCECFLDGVKLFSSKIAPADGAVGLRAHMSAVRFRNLKVAAPDGAVLLEGLPNLPTTSPPVEKSAIPPDHTEPLTLAGHTHYVWNVAFSPDGKRLISGAQDNTVKLWDAVNGKFIKDIAHDRDRFTGVAWSPNGNLLAAGSAAPVIQVWNADSGELVHNLLGHGAGVRCVAFSRDGKWLASGSYDKTVRLWDLTTGKEKYTMREHSGLVHSVAFSHDDKHLASGSFDRTIRIWDVASGAEQGCLRGHTGDVLGVAFDPESKRLASASQDGTVRIWNLNRDGDDRVLRAAAPQHRIFAVAFSPDGKILASGSDKALILWNPTTGAEITQLTGNTKSVFGLSFSSDGRRLASAGGDHTVRVWDVTLFK